MVAAHELRKTWWGRGGEDEKLIKGFVGRYRYSIEVGCNAVIVMGKGAFSFVCVMEYVRWSVYSRNGANANALKLVECLCILHKVSQWPGVVRA